MTNLPSHEEVKWVVSELNGESVTVSVVLMGIQSYSFIVSGT